MNGVIENVGDGKTHERLILRTTKTPRKDCRLRLFEFEGFVQNTLLRTGIEVGSADVVGSAMIGGLALTKLVFTDATKYCTNTAAGSFPVHCFSDLFLVETRFGFFGARCPK